MVYKKKEEDQGEIKEQVVEEPIAPEDRELREDEQPVKKPNHTGEHWAKEKARLKRHIADLEAKIENLEGQNKELVKSKRVTTVPGAGTPVSCIDDTGGEPIALSKAKRR